MNKSKRREKTMRKLKHKKRTLRGGVYEYKSNNKESKCFAFNR
jgi:hypothetical protein